MPMLHLFQLPGFFRKAILTTENGRTLLVTSNTHYRLLFLSCSSKTLFTLELWKYSSFLFVDSFIYLFIYTRRLATEEEKLDKLKMEMRLFQDYISHIKNGDRRNL